MQSGDARSSRRRGTGNLSWGCVGFSSGVWVWRARRNDEETLDVWRLTEYRAFPYGFLSYSQAAVQASKIRIRLRSFETNHMQSACDKILAAAAATEARVSGPVPLPTKRRIFCVLRSPHVNKDSREHFETRTHHRLIDVHQPTAQTIDALMALELPSGVDVEIKL